MFPFIVMKKNFTQGETIELFPTEVTIWYSYFHGIFCYSRSNELHLAHWLFLFKMYFKTNWSAKRNINLHNNLIRNIHCLWKRNIRETDSLKQCLFNIRNLNSTFANKIVLFKRIVIWITVVETDMKKSEKIVMGYGL